MNNLDSPARRQKFVSTKQQTYLGNRKRKLQKLFNDGRRDLQELELPWTRFISSANSGHYPGPNPFNQDTWFKAKGMSSDWRDILESLGIYAKFKVTADELSTIDSIIDDETETWVKREAEDFGLKFIGDTSDYQQTTGIWWLREIVKTESELEVSGDADKRIFRNLRKIFYFVDHLRTMRRLADLRNAKTTVRPTFDGSNISDHFLKTSYMLHRAWVRTLHYKALAVGNDDIGFQHIKNILKLSIAFLAMEFQLVPISPSEKQQNPPGLEEIRMMYEKLEGALGDIGWCIISNTSPASIGENDEQKRILNNILHNTESARLKNFMRMYLDPIGGQFNLWFLLLQKAADFDRAMEEEHVEDVLINKHIVFDDEEYQISNLLINENYLPSYVRDLGIFKNDNEDKINMVKPYLKRIQQVNRTRRNYLMLKDWIPRQRPWRQLWMVIDTTEGNEDALIGPIQEFHRKISALEIQYPRSSHFNPSREANVWKRLFPIHPIAATDLLPEANCPEFHKPCLSCFENFKDEPGRVIAELHCGHWFHYTCIRKFWDQPHMLTFPCMSCRLSKMNWSLADTVGIRHEVYDVFGFREEFPFQPNQEPAYDIPDDFYANEIERMQDSVGYRRADGYGYGDPLREDASNPRLAHVEVSLVRHYRRLRDASRSKNIRDLGRGLAGLDPPDPDPEPFVPSGLTDDLQEEINMIEAEIEGLLQRRKAQAMAAGNELLGQIFDLKIAEKTQEARLFYEGLRDWEPELAEKFLQAFTKHQEASYVTLRRRR